MANRQYPLLFSPIDLGPVRLKNRAVFSAHLTNLAEDHRMSARQAYYYEARAKGGCALIITEEVSVHPSDWAYEKLIDAFEPEVVAGYRFACDRVHRQGGKIFLQLNHNGSQGDSTYSRRPLWTASVISDPLFRETAKAMELHEIEELIAYYALSAEYAKAGNFDGIELQGSHSSILRQFLSPFSNQRMDSYGGSLANRFRLIARIGAAVRSVLGPDLALGIRYSVEEFVAGGLTVEDTIAIARLTEETGWFDYLNFSTGIATHQLYLVEGTMAVPPAYAAQLVGQVRAAVKLPVLVAGRIKDPKQAEKVLQQGQADLVGMVRAQISDPYLMKKAAEGEDEQINGCLSCNQDCIGRVGLNKSIGCVQNPYLGREQFLMPDRLPPVFRSEHVVVVGGGPAGLEAALVAAMRGYRVTLLEQSAALGGRIPLAASLPARAELGDSIRNLTNQLARYPVDIRFNSQATAETVLALYPAAVVIATGAKPAEHYLRNGQAHVYDLVDWLSARPALGPRVAVVDLLGSFAAAGTAELLLDMGKQVELCCGALQAGAGLGRTTDLELWTRRVKQKGARLTTNVSVAGIAGPEVTLMNNYTGQTATREFDQVLISAPLYAENQLYYQLKDQLPAFLVGDALAPRNLGTALYEGFEAAIRI